MKKYWVDLPLSWWERIDAPVEGAHGFSYWEIRRQGRRLISECKGQCSTALNAKPEDGVYIIFHNDEAYVKFRLCHLP